VKSLRCTLRFEESAMHPVHRRLMTDEALVSDQLLHSHRADEGPDTLLFYVEGDREAFVDALETTDRIVDYRVAPLGDDACYAYVREESTDFDAQLEEAFERPGLLLIPPVEFRNDGTARFTVVGEPDALQTALEDVPAEARIDIDRIGDYNAPPSTADTTLTDRQREAAAAAFELGYYDVPREGSVSDVADRLDCAPGTASEHLRKAEQQAVAAMLERVP
jgi:predicted DNA binding protein